MKYLIPLISIFYVTLSYSQVHDFSDRIVKESPSCSQITKSCLKLLPEFYDSNKIDSALMLIDYWEENCGYSEPSMRSKILFSIAGDHAADLRTLDLDYLVAYGGNEIKANFFAPSYYGYRYNIVGNVPFMFSKALLVKFDAFTIRMAKELRRSSNFDSGLEQDLLDFYSGNHIIFWNGLKNQKYVDSDIQAIYDERIEDALKKKPQTNYALLTGAWIPNGNASLIGPKPEIGVLGGVKFNRLMMDAVMAFKFTRSNEAYQALSRDSLFESKDFFGGYIGFETGYIIARNLRNELFGLGGVAIDGFDLLNFDEDSEFESISVNSLNLNLGLGYRYFYSASNYLSLRAQYNFVNYENPGGTDFSGNTVTLRLLWGFSGNALKTYLLPRMYYYD